MSCALLLAGCAGPVDVTAPDPGAQAAACTSLVDDLPELVGDQERRTVETPYAAAWGDPAIVLRCGVPQPEDFDALSSCQITDGVAWFVPEEQITGQAEDVVMTTIGREPGVEVSIPSEYFPPAGTMVDLAETLKQHTERVERCG